MYEGYNYYEEYVYVCMCVCSTYGWQNTNDYVGKLFIKIVIWYNLYVCDYIWICI